MGCVRWSRQGGGQVHLWSLSAENPGEVHCWREAAGDASKARHGQLNGGYSWDAHSCQPAVLKDSSNNCLLLKVGTEGNSNQLRQPILRLSRGQLHCGQMYEKKKFTEHLCFVFWTTIKNTPKKKKKKKKKKK